MISDPIFLYHIYVYYGLLAPGSSGFLLLRTVCGPIAPIAMAPSLETSPQYVVTSWLPGKMQLFHGLHT